MPRFRLFLSLSVDTRCIQPKVIRNDCGIGCEPIFLLNTEISVVFDHCIHVVTRKRLGIGCILSVFIPDIRQKPVRFLGNFDNTRPVPVHFEYLPHNNGLSGIRNRCSVFESVSERHRHCVFRPGKRLRPHLCRLTFPGIFPFPFIAAAVIGFYCMENQLPFIRNRASAFKNDRQPVSYKFFMHCKPLYLRIAEAGIIANEERCRLPVHGRIGIHVQHNCPPVLSVKNYMLY